jgi:alpha-L-rhamnosidase
LNKQLFQNPPMNCRAMPFWSWNGKLDVEETRWQVREMSEKGMGGGFMHARPGLSTEYLGEEWFQNCKAAIDEGSKTDFALWLYDEDRWPSGSAGGVTASQNPDYRSRVLVMQRNHEPILNNTTRGNDTEKKTFDKLECIGHFEIKTHSKNQHGFQAVNENETASNIISFYAATLPPTGWQNDGYYPDLLNPDAVQEFLRNTYEPYSQEIGKFFGKEVPGIFTDEPLTYGPLPWSVTLVEEFKKRRQYDLRENLPALCFHTKESPRIRHDYWRTVYELFSENYMPVLAKWCEKHNLALTGHMMNEHNLSGQISYSGGTMAHYVHMQVPGIDILNNRMHEISTCKQASSICNQFDKPLMLSETYGGAGYLFSFAEQKLVGDWQMALGVNFLCPHLTPYTMKGIAKRDYPGNFFYQSPWWRYYRHIADYQARLSYILRQGAPVRNILVIHPLTGAWCEFDPTVDFKSECGLKDQNQAYDDILKQLVELHRDFDLGDELVMAQHARIQDSKFQVGGAEYELLIVPPTSNLESSTVDLLEQFVGAGGSLLWIAPTPTWVDGRPSGRIEKIVNGSRVLRVDSGRFELKKTLDSLLPQDVLVIDMDTNVDAYDVICQHRIVESKHILFLTNTKREARVSLRICIPQKGKWEHWDCETGEASNLPSIETDTGSQVELTLAPAGSIVLAVDTKEEAFSQNTSPVKPQEKTCEISSPWEFQRLAPNSIVLDKCAYSIDNEPFSEEMFTVEAQAQWRKRFNLMPMPTMNIDTQPWKRLQNPQNIEKKCRLTLQYTFEVANLPSTETYLALEDREEFDFLLNGEHITRPTNGWFLDKSFGKVEITDRLQTGKNTITLSTDLTDMKVIEDIYVIGDFAIDPQTLEITSEPERLRTGDWCEQGYPFYTDGMLYKTTINIDENFKGRVFLELEKYEGTVAAVWVNDEKAGILGWRPYRSDITRFLQAGSNDLGIEVIGSARNLLGPRHSSDPAPRMTSFRNLTETSTPHYNITPAGLTGAARIIYSQ